eukprot:3826213-Rhodomonas_salina.1
MFLVPSPPAWLPPIQLTGENDSEDMQMYRQGTPSGPYRDRGGVHAWTDGSLRKVEGEMAMGAGWITLAEPIGPGVPG